MTPCAHCESDTATIIRRGPPQHRVWYVRCQDCGMRTSLESTRKLAIAVWDRRPTGERAAFFDPFESR